MRHAYLILAHRDLPMLEKLLQLLDNPNNHIFVPLDKKSGIDPSKIKSIPILSKLTFTTRLDIRWGEASQPRAYLNILKTAYNFDDFDWFHFISGSDIPLMPIANINVWYENQHGIHAVIDIENAGEREIRLKYYYFRVNHHIQRILNFIQKITRINRLKKIKEKFPTIFYGSAWFDLTPHAVKIILDNESSINQIVPFTTCSDELLFHTVLGNSNLRLHKDYHRYIDWSDKLPNPKTLTIEDYDKIIQSGAFFARKLDSSISKDLIMLLDKHNTITDCRN